MAHKHAAIKHVRQTQRKTARNKTIKERIKDATKNLHKLAESKASAEAKAVLPKLFKLLDKAAKEQTIHQNRANRLKSSWTKKINSLSK